MVFNGDVLSGVDLPSVVATHRGNSADVTLHLVKVGDPRPFGSVPTSADGRVLRFVEKSDNPPTDQINAGCYVFRRDVIAAIPANVAVSVERDTFPGLLADGARIFGHVDNSYWLDLGTPSAFVQGSADLVSGVAPTSAFAEGADRTRDRLILAGCDIAPDAVIDSGSAVGAGVTVGSAAVVRGSVVMDGAILAPGSIVERSVIGSGATVGTGSVVTEAIVGDLAVIGAGCELRNGIRIWPGVNIPSEGVQFSAET